MTMDNTDINQHKLYRTLVWSGFKQLAPISLFVTAFGAAFGLAATQAGVSETTIRICFANRSKT